ncbi:flagellar biosynthesis anti-sigma factor FlgM [Kluyvera chengduensis]|uniref:flagellar biosynthesis anti-sigma factor FlgM n=1 Tax=Kluyvera sp. 142359 TaxID=3375726 RepID=UPI0037725FC5
MKITPMISGSRPASVSGSERNKQNSTAQSSTSNTSTLSADDITQAGLQSAQQTLNNDAQDDVDYDKVAQMQAALAAGQLQVNPDDLAADMLSYFQQ